MLVVVWYVGVKPQDAKLGAATVKEFEVEFLMVQMEVSMPKVATSPPVFSRSTFPVENRGSAAPQPGRAPCSSVPGSGAVDERSSTRCCNLVFGPAVCCASVVTSVDAGLLAVGTRDAAGQAV